MKKVSPYGQKFAVGALIKTLFPASKRESPKTNNAACFCGNFATQVDGMRRVAQKQASKSALNLAISVLAGG